MKNLAIWYVIYWNNNMKTDKLILDACCGGRMFYYDKNDERVLFQDIRNISTHLCDGRKFEVKPDVQADFTNMPYEDECFQMVVLEIQSLLTYMEVLMRKPNQPAISK